MSDVESWVFGFDESPGCAPAISIKDGKGFRPADNTDFMNLINDHSRLARENEKLKKAVDFYADPENWAECEVNGMFFGTTEDKDQEWIDGFKVGGKIAREALK